MAEEKKEEWRGTLGYLFTGLESLGQLTIFGLGAAKAAFERPFEFDETMRQLYEVGWKSLPLVLSSGFALGIVFSLHTISSLTRFGASAMIPAVLAIGICREIGPLFVALLIAGRVGAGIGAELGGMRVTEQIDALEAMAVDSFKYLVVTRVIACAIALPILAVFIDASGILGGYLADSAVGHTSWRFFMTSAFGQLGWTDYVPPTVKTVVFGAIIGVVSCFLGYTATEGAAGVGRASTRSVVYSSLLLILINIILVKLSAFLFLGP